MSFAEDRSRLSAQRQSRNQLDGQLHEQRESLRTLAARLALLRRTGHAESDEFQQLTARISQLQDSIPQLQQQLGQANSLAHDLLIELLDVRPQQAVEHLDDRIPFLLLPIRIETRFRKVPEPDTGATADELWVRIYPDDVHVETHEEILTVDEVATAQTYWTEVWRAGGDADRELAAWRVLMRNFGAPRAAWIVRSYRPNNELDTLGNSQRPSAPLDDDQPLEPAPEFDPYDAKQEAWSRAPRVTTMPDRFVVMGIIGGKVVVEQMGNLIPNPLIVGPNPSPADPAKEGFREDAEELEVDEEMRWMVDFEEAVRVGMGIKIRLSGSTTRGFQRLLVLGLRLSADEKEGQQLVESLFTSHHFSEDGMSLVPQGSATNNTDKGGSGFKSFELGDDDSRRVELGAPLFTPEFDWKRKRDGQHLAEALGIDPAVLQHVAFSDGFDQRDARAMNTALWPATLGYFLDEMMEPLFSDATVSATRRFFLNHVSGRGRVPAIRIGTQPYGVLPTSSWSRWRFPAESTPGATALVTTHPFEKKLFNFIGQLDQEAKKLLPDVPHAGQPGDPGKNLLAILGLHAGSAEFHARFAISLEQLTNMLKLKQLNLATVDLIRLIRSSWSDVLADFGAAGDERPEIYQKIFYRTQTALNGPLVDSRPLSETERLQILSAGDENYLEWLATSPVDTIRRQDFGRIGGQPVKSPRALLYLMLRHAIMNAYAETAWNFLASAKLDVPPRKEPALLYVAQNNPGQSKFSWLYRPAGELSVKHPTVFQDSKLSVAEQISQDALIRLRPESQNLREVREALTCLARRPTAALGRVFSEHLDTCSYRLDAWKLGFVNQRLAELRGPSEASRRGVYLGSFGWLEDVHPRPALQPFSGTAPPEFENRADPPLQVAADNGGYIHAPSLNHAVTAAILRNAYIEHADRDHESVAAVNLTSERVRTALAIIEGVQNGQELAALLGYQFERGLHDRYNQAEVDKFIYPLRLEFQLVADQLIDTSEDVNRPADLAIEALEARNVINGLSLLKHIQKTGNDTYPFGKTTLPDATPAQADAINAEVNRLANALDAVGDLLMSEGVYQVVRGNFERAGAAVDSLSKGDHLPDPEIVQTPRSGFAMTHRLTLQLETGIVPAEQNPYAAQAVPLTARAAAEVGLNKWLAMLGDPTKLVCRVVHVETVGAGESSHTVEHPLEVTLVDLRLQPIDLVYLWEETLAQDQSELDQRIALAARAKAGLAYDAALRIDFTQPVAGKITFFELQPLIHSLRTMVVDSRPLHAADLILPSDDSGTIAPQVAPDPNPSGWDVAELQSRVTAGRDQLAGLRTDLAGFAGSDPATLNFGLLRDKLMQVAEFGIQQSIPASAIETTADIGTMLLEQAATVVQRIEERLAAFNQTAPLPVPPDASIDEQVSAWIDAGKTLLGASFNWIPKFTHKLPAEIQNAHADRDHIQRHAASEMEFPIDEWLYGVARIRPKAAALEQATMLAETFGFAGVPALSVMQLPYRADDFWLAVQYPSDYVIDGDRLLLANVLAAPMAAHSAQAGLLLDEWTESVPTENETTGIAFHYDAPNSEPPQTLLLAVAPRLTGSWQWEDLVATLNETLDMSKQRAIEPDQIDETRFAQFLPAAMIPATRYLVTVATNLLVNVGATAPLDAVELEIDE